MDIVAGSLLITVLVLAFVVGSLTSLVKVLAVKVMDLGEIKQLEKVVDKRRDQELPEVFREDDEPESAPLPRRTRAAAREPRDLWQRIPNNGDT